MKISKVSRRYSKALFEAIGSHESLRKLLDELAEVVEVLGASPDLKSLLGHPRLGVEQKQKLVKSAFEGRVDENTFRLLSSLAQRNRFSALPGIVIQLDRMVLESEGVERATVTSAMPLEDQQRDKVIAKLSALTGKRIELTTSVEPSLIGGMIIRVGDRLIDGSIRHQLEKLRENLNAVRVAN